MPTEGGWGSYNRPASPSPRPKKRPLNESEVDAKTYKHHYERLKVKFSKLEKANATLIDLDRSNQIVIRDLKKRNDELRIQLKGTS